MKADCMAPLGAAMLAYFEGDRGVQVTVRRDDGQVLSIPVGHFFRGPSGFTPIDTAALRLSAGRVLDVGAGTGRHSLELQRRGLSVTAIDICEDAVAIMKRSGVKHTFCGDIFEIRGQRYETLLLMGHGVGIVETIAGLDRFLTFVPQLLSEGGQVLADSLDVRATTDPANLAYHEANRIAGRYIGEIRMCAEFEDAKGVTFGWLQVDGETLAERAEAAGLGCEIVLREETGDYLARLTKQ